MNNLNGNNTVEPCESTVIGDYNVTISVICATLALFGLVYIYFGKLSFQKLMI